MSKVGHVLIVLLIFPLIPVFEALGNSQASEIQVRPGLNEFIDCLEALEAKAYDKAEVHIKKALSADPQNPQYIHHLGVVMMLQGRDKEAISIFEGLIDQRPKESLDALLALASIHLKQKNTKNAFEVFERGKAHFPESGRLHLEFGNLLREMGSYKESLNSLDSAIRFDPSLEQPALLLKGLALLEMGSYDESEKTLKLCIEVSPGSLTAESARETLKSIPDIKRSMRPLFANLNMSWTYDDNVAQYPLEEVAKTKLTTNKADQYESLQVRLGYRIIKTKTKELSVGYGIQNVGYKDRVENAVFAHVPFLSFSESFKKISISIPYEFYSFYTGARESYQDSGLYLTMGSNSQRKLKMHSISPVISFIEPFNMKSDLLLSYQNKEYIDESPDSSAYSVGINQHLRVGTGFSPRLGIKYLKESSEEAKSSYKSIQFLVGFLSKLPFEIYNDISLVHSNIEYEDENYFGEGSGTRKDSSYNLSLSFYRSFFRWMTLFATYSYYHNNSNAQFPDPFMFEKNVITFGVSINY